MNVLIRPLPDVGSRKALAFVGVLPYTFEPSIQWVKAFIFLFKTTWKHKLQMRLVCAAMNFTCDRIRGIVPSKLFPNVERIKFMQVTWPLPNGLKTGSFLGMAIGRHSGWGRATLTPVCAAEQHRNADPSPYFHHRFQYISNIAIEYLAVV